MAGKTTQGMSRLERIVAASAMTWLGAAMVALGQISVLPTHFV